MTTATTSAVVGSPAREGEPAWPAAGLSAWYEQHGRHDLSWRLTRDPYSILVSEVMLQQTQVSRVLPAWAAWLSLWPTVDALAAARRADVIRAWAGLGYNRRAAYLHEAVRLIARSARFPATVDALQSLPGVGAYTAGAVACFAFDAPVAVLDTNIRRVLARSRGGRASAAGMAERELSRLAAAVLPRGPTRSHNLALMDLGALLCRATRPTCDACPLRAGCRWVLAGCPPGERSAASPSVRFEDSARFARGRILAGLRDMGRLDRSAIERLLPTIHAPRALEYLAALEKEGLVVGVPGGMWGLPEETSLGAAEASADWDRKRGHSQPSLGRLEAPLPAAPAPQSTSMASPKLKNR